MISTDANGVHEIKQLRVFEPQYGMLVPNLKVKRAKKNTKTCHLGIFGLAQDAER